MTAYRMCLRLSRHFLIRFRGWRFSLPFNHQGSGDLVVPALLSLVKNDPEKTQIKNQSGKQVTYPAQEGDAWGHHFTGGLDDLQTENHLSRRLTGGAVKIGEIKHPEEMGHSVVDQEETPHDFSRFQAVKPGVHGRQADQEKEKADKKENEFVDKKGKGPFPESPVLIRRHDALP